MTDQLRISATLFTTWLKCPAQAAGRLAGHYPADTIHTFKGLLAHRIFARHITTGRIPPDQFDQACRQEIGSTNLNYKMRDLQLRPREVKAVIRQVADLYRGFKPASGMTAEVHLEHPITDEVVLAGRIDAVSGEPPTLIDWKVGELGDAADQLRFYAVLWTLARGVMPLSVVAVSVGTGERHQEWIDRELFASTLASIAECAADLTTPGAVTEPGPWCRWCPLLDGCQPGQQTLTTLGERSTA